MHPSLPGFLLSSTTARAASPAADHAAPQAAGDLGLVLGLLLFVGLAYLLAHFVVDWFQRRLLVVTGLEYVLLGVLLGPSAVEQVHVFKDLTGLAPIIAFAAGWVGLLYGMELDVRGLATSGDRSLRLAVVESALTGGIVALASQALLTSGLFGLPALPSNVAIISASVLGCTAAAGSSSAVDLIRSRYPSLESDLLPLLRRTARLEDLLAIIVFGLIFCVFHQGSTRTAAPPAISDWVLLTTGLGLALGFLFTTFLGDDTSENSRFLALVGIIVFASGAAFFLNLSALLVNLLLGAVIVNTRHGEAVFHTLGGTQRPVRLVLLVFAGALWVPVEPLPAVLLAVAYAVARVVGKALACWVSALGTNLRNDLFRGLLAQGDVAIAMAISFRLVYHGPAVDLAYTAILASVVLNEFFAPRLLKELLVDAGELRQDIDPNRAHAAEAG